MIATKGRFPTGPDANGVGLSRRHLQRAVDASLRRLGVDCIDLYQVHAWDPLTPLDETLRALDDMVRAGKIRYVGLSNFTGWQVQKAVGNARQRGLEAPVTLQPQYNLLVREVEWEIVPACLDTGLSVCCRGPLWAADGSPASTGGTPHPSAPPGSARTQTAGSRPTPGVPPRSGHGMWSTRCGASPIGAGCQWRRWPCPGW